MDINRKVAYNTLFEIEKNGAYSNIELNNQIKNLNPDSPGFVREIVYGVLENKIYLDYILKNLIPRGLKGVKKQDLTILRMGLYQLIFMNSVPSYAAINESVKLAKKLCRGRDGFINGVLRGYEKKKNSIKFPNEEYYEEYLKIKYSYENWIIRLWLDSYGKEMTESLLKAGNQTPKLSIRVNKLKITRDELLLKLKEKNVDVSISNICENGLIVKGHDILQLDEYKKGLFSIQDEASMLVAEIMKPEQGDSILDICAAPGGKTLAMSELMANKGKVYAFDVYEHKLKLLEKESKRLGISIIKTKENDGQLFNEDFVCIADKVLVDGPCSGLGVIRKKPEIKYKVLEDNGKSLSDKQLKILSVSSEYVKDGGVLVYSTCTINPLENNGVVMKFLENHKEYVVEYERQLFPNEDLTDGFYICKMRKEVTVKGV